MKSSENTSLSERLSAVDGCYMFLRHIAVDLPMSDIPRKYYECTIGDGRVDFRTYSPVSRERSIAEMDKKLTAKRKSREVRDFLCRHGLGNCNCKSEMSIRLSLMGA